VRLPDLSTIRTRTRGAGAFTRKAAVTAVPARTTPGATLKERAVTT
jgi:hypothetical protein